MEFKDGLHWVELKNVHVNKTLSEMEKYIKTIEYKNKPLIDKIAFCSIMLNLQKKVINCQTS